MAQTQVRSGQILDASLTHADIASANIDGTAGTPSLRTLGTGALQALAGNTVVNSVAIGAAVTSGTVGSVLFVSTGPVLAQSNANLFWDDTAKRLSISGAAPGLVLTDTTGSAKSLTIAVDANVAQLRESAGASGSLVCLDLANNRVGIGTVSPGTPLHVKGGPIEVSSATAGASTYANREDSIIFSRNDLPSSYLHKITASYSATPLESTLSFEISSGSGTFVSAITMTGTGLVITPALTGSQASGGTITLSSTSHATKGKVLFGTSAYDEVNNWLGLGVATPLSPLHVKSTLNEVARIEGTGANYSYISFYQGTSRRMLFGQLAGGFPGLWADADPMVFYTNGGFERLRIENNGNIGINNTSPTAGKLDIAVGTITTLLPAINSIATWNAVGVTFTHIKHNVTNTASAAGSLLLDLQVGGASMFSARKDGLLTVTPLATPAAALGTLYHDSTRQAVGAGVGVSATPVNVCLSGTLGVTTTSVSSTTTAETKSLIGTITGTFTCPANFMVVGKKLRLRLYGHITTGGTAGTITAFVKFAGTTVASTGAVAPTINQANRYWEAEVDMVCRTVGATGKLMVQGMVFVMNAATPSGGVVWPIRGNSADPPTDLSVDTTASSLIDFQTTTSNNSHTVVCNMASLEVLN